MTNSNVQFRYNIVMVTHLLNGFSETVEIVLDQALSLKDIFPQQTHKSQKPEDMQCYVNIKITS